MKKVLALISVMILSCAVLSAQEFKLNESGYFKAGGVDAMAFDDFYPEGHQGGVAVIMNARRILTNGDIRFEPTPGQWQPLPMKVKREVEGNKIITYLAYPDSSRHLTGFNPMVYPDMQLTYTVTLESYGKGLKVTVDLDQPIPERFLGKVGFNLELFPGYLFGEPWIMDGKTGIFPRQPNGPIEESASYIEHAGDYHIDGRPLASVERFNRPYANTKYTPFKADEIVAAPYAQGTHFTLLPGDDLSRIKITSNTGEMKLYDGRMNQNNGWFVLRQEVAAGKTKGAVEWIIEPNVVEDWIYPPVIQTSQIGYHVNQPKVAIIESDVKDTPLAYAQVIKIGENGEEVVKVVDVKKWDGKFLRYDYYKADFTEVTEPGLYKIRYGKRESTLFRIDANVYERGVWQPVIEYFLPVQMCHMRVMEKFRVWHDRCHMDDGPMAQPGNLFDGYDQSENDYGRIKPGEIVPGMNIGGWHDAGDFDLRVESQSNESYILALTYEAFHPEIDVTAIDFDHQNVEIHESDGTNDILQQVENGMLTVVNSYLALGKFYRGIICNSLRQYVLLGDASSMTDGIIGNEDDRWVYTQKNPNKDLGTAAGLAASARVLRGVNDTLATHCENIAREVFDYTEETWPGAKINAAVELYLTTGEAKYFNYLIDNWDLVVKVAERQPWCTARFAKMLDGQKKYQKQAKAYRAALEKYKADIEEQATSSPYGVPYRPSIWGAGWTIQSFGYDYWFAYNSFPDIFSPEPIFNALNFVLGCHPGTNQQSFASGVGTESATVGYGANRADWSYIPGGVVSGTALIRPDFPELMVFPFLWQQVEYCLGGDSSHFMFLALAAQDILNKK